MGSVVQAETLLPEIPEAHSMTPVGFSSEALALRSLTRLYLQIPVSGLSTLCLLNSWHSGSHICEITNCASTRVL